MYWVGDVCAVCVRSPVVVVYTPVVPCTLLATRLPHVL